MIWSKDIPRRFGRFAIKQHFIRDLKGMQMAQKILSHVVVIKCEYNYYSEELLYEAWSPEFRELDEGVVMPRYTAVVNCNDDSVSFVEQERQ